MLCLYIWFCVLKNKVTCLQSSKRVVYFQPNFQDANTDKAANVYKNVFHIEFKITSTKVFFFYFSEQLCT